MIFKVWLNQIFSNFNTMLWTIKYRLSSITMYFPLPFLSYGPFSLRKYWLFRFLNEVLLNQIFLNFNTMLYSIKYRLNLIMVYFTFTIHKLGFLSITRICKCLMAMKWISCKINHNMFHSFRCLIQNLECRGICDHQINFL